MLVYIIYEELDNFLCTKNIFMSSVLVESEYLLSLDIISVMDIVYQVLMGQIPHF